MINSNNNIAIEKLSSLSIDTPEKLSKWMSDNITYGYVSKSTKKHIIGNSDESKFYLDYFRRHMCILHKA